MTQSYTLYQAVKKYTHGHVSLLKTNERKAEKRMIS